MRFKNWLLHLDTFTILLHLLVLLFFTSYAQVNNSQKSLIQYTLDSWNEKNGIPQSTIKSIIQSKDGFIWFGTEEGLVRFDGESFKIFNSDNVKEIKENMVVTIAEDNYCNLWIGTYDGLLKYSNRSFTRYSVKDGLASSLIRILFIDSRNRIWIGTNNGLNLFENNIIKTFYMKDGLTSQNINSICEDKNGRIIIGTRGGGLNIYNESKFISYQKKDGLLDDDVRAVFVDSKNNIWLGLNENGTQIIKNTGAVSKVNLKDNIFSNSTVYHFMEDNSSNIWISTSLGLIRYDNHSIESMGTHNGYPFKRINNTFVDKESNIWIASNGNGLFRFRNSNIKSITSLTGLQDNDVRVFAIDKSGSIWAGAQSNFVAVISKDGITNLKVGNSNVADGVRSIIEFNNELWVGTNGNGIYRYHHGAFNNYKISAIKESNYVTAFYIDSANKLWIGTDGGLYEFADGKFVSHGFDESTINLRVRFIIEDKLGNLWLGSLGRGLVKYSNNKYDFFTEKYESFGNIIRAIYVDTEGIIWAASNRGIVLVNNNKANLISRKDGLFYNGGFSILLDKSGYFWISCNLGIYKVKRDELISISEGKLQSVKSIVYGIDDGMPSAECNGGYQGSAVKTLDGTFWFATINGIAIVDPYLNDSNPLPAPTYIEELKFDGKPYPIINGNKIEAEAGTKQIDILFTGIAFSNPGKLKFSYILEGLSEKWSEPAPKRNVSYGYLSPGDYTFKVKTCNSSGIWNEKVSSFSFYVAPYFYQTAWFYLFLSILVITFLHFIIKGKFRIQKILAEELDKKVKLKTAELHKEIKEKETAQLEAEKYSSLLNGIIKKKDKFFSIIAHDLRNPLHAIVSTAQFIYENKMDISPKDHDRCIEIIYSSSERLNKLIENLLDWSRIQTGRFDYQMNQFNLSELTVNVQSLLNPSALQKNIIMENKLRNELPVYADYYSIQSVLLNLITNAIKFTHQYGIITIDSIEDEDFITVSVKDNGIGIPADEIDDIFNEGGKGSRNGTANEIGTGLGLTLCKEHIEKNGGKIWVVSKEGEGSEFCFILPKRVL